MASDIFIASFISQELERPRPRRALAMMEQVELYGTKVFQKLQYGRYAYGMHVYSEEDLPNDRAQVDLDDIEITPVCTVMDWGLSEQGYNEVEERDDCPLVPVSRCAILISNAEECPDVEW